jgi:hypothetical protein
MLLDLARRTVALLNRRTLFLLTALVILLLGSGMRGRLLGHRDETDRPVTANGSPDLVPALPARLVHLKPGSRLGIEGPAPGWTHLVLKSVPTLKTGDLDTVSEQAYETARRIRPVILADVRQDSAGSDSTFRLERVGVGLCAPGAEPGTDRVVSASSIERTRGPWTAKQRLILTAMSLETSRAHLAVATPTFALLRTPVTFLISGAHRKVDVCYALVVEPRRGQLRTFVWVDASGADAPSSAQPVARLFTTPVFDSPLDVKASKILGQIPVAWSFAIRELPPGADVPLPPELSSLLDAESFDEARAAEVEQTFQLLLEKQGPGAGLAP